MDNENILEQLQEMLSNMPDAFSILEEEIDVATQLKYQKIRHKLVENKNDEESIFNQRDELFLEEKSIDEKKDLLILLAQIDDVKAFRTIEKFKNENEYKNEDEEFKNWIILAYQESKMLMESSLLEEKKIFISSGLGGKGTSLRYFAVCFSESSTNFTKIQQKIIKSEFEFIFQQSESEIEEINFGDGFAIIIAIIPLKHQVHLLFKDAISQCNELGDFLRENILITNLKKFSVKEIEQVLKGKSHKNPKILDDELLRDFMQKELDIEKEDLDEIE